MRRYYFAKQLICWESFFARVVKTGGRYFSAQILAQVLSADPLPSLSVPP